MLGFVVAYSLKEFDLYGCERKGEFVVEICGERRKCVCVLVNEFLRKVKRATRTL